MTDEERRKLIKRLREVMFMGTSYEPLCSEAADEIERLTAENKELKKTLHHFLRYRETDMGTAE